MHFLRKLLLFQRYQRFKFFTFKKQVKIAEYNFHNQMENIKIQKSRSTHFCASSNHFKDVNISIFTLKKQVKVRMQNLCNNVIPWQMSKTYFFTFFISAKVRPVLTFVKHAQTDRQTHTHRYGQAHRYRRNLEDLPKYMV